jgi:hypothetical protein
VPNDFYGRGKVVIRDNIKKRFFSAPAEAPREISFAQRVTELYVCNCMFYDVFVIF